MNASHSSPLDSSARFAAAAALLSVVAAAGSVWLSLGLKLKACETPLDMCRPPFRG